jgi:cation diffusion facilitator family transporter
MNKEAKKVTLMGLIVNLLLSIFKIVSGIVGRSSAMLADGIHSVSDILTDVVVFIGFKFSSKPEDKCHNYGHEKYETIATAIISIFLSIVAFNILKSGVNKIYLSFQGYLIPKPSAIALLAAGISIFVKEIMFHYTMYVGKKIESPSIKANAWHHRSDVYSSIGTLFGIGGAIILGNRWTILDPIASVIVSILIFKVSIEILTPVLKELTDSAMDAKEILYIKEVLDSFDEIENYHNLRTRRMGKKAIIDVHIIVNKDLSIKIAHDISTEAEEKLKSEFGNFSIITIHIETSKD